MSDDMLDRMIAWEQGTLSENDTIALFQELVNSGLAWKLQGAYGRTAANLISLGLVTPGKETPGADPAELRRLSAAWHLERKPSERKKQMSNDKKTWTVIGFWWEDRLVVTGVVEGSHFVYGGDTSEIDGAQGEWADFVEAATAEKAEETAVESAEADDEYEYNDNDMENPYPRDRKDGEGLGLTRPSYGD